MPVLKAVNKVITKDGVEHPIDLYYHMVEPPNANANTPTAVIIAGLGASLVTTSYNHIVVPLVNAGYRVLRFSNRDCDWSTHCRFLPDQGVVWSGLKNRINATNPEHHLNFPLPAKHPLNTTDHVPPETDADYPAELLVPGSRPTVFMQDPQYMSPNRAPYPHSVKKGFLYSIGMTKTLPAYDLFDMAMDTLLLCQRLNIKKAHFMGISMGGFILQSLAAIKPSLIQSATLVMTGTGNGDYGAAFSFVFKTFVTRKPPAANAPMEELLRFAAETQSLIGRPNNEGKTFNNGQKMMDWMAQIGGRCPREPTAMQRQIANLDGQESKDYILEFIAQRIPTLVFHGDSDHLVPTANAYHSHDIITHSLTRAVHPPTKRQGKDKETPPQLETIKQVLEEDGHKLHVTTVIGNQLPDGRQNFHTLAILEGFAHEMDDGYNNALIPQFVAHIASAEGKKDVLMPRVFDKVEFGTEPDLLFGCPNPTASDLSAPDPRLPIEQPPTTEITTTTETTTTEITTKETTTTKAETTPETKQTTSPAPTAETKQNNDDASSTGSAVATAQ